MAALTAQLPDPTSQLRAQEIAHADLLEAKGVTRQIFDTINGHLAEKGFMMREWTIVDATLMAAPRSTKNKDGRRDPEMHQSKKGNDPHFGMKVHVGVDAASGLVHTVIDTAGNIADVTQAHALLMATSRPRSATPATRGGKAARKHRQIGDVARSHESVQTQGSAQQ
jgi:IS5 family transposase